MFGLLRTRKGKPKPTFVKILLDSGASQSIIKKQFVKKRKQVKEPTTQWTTAAGTFTTNSKCKVEFNLNEFSEKKLVDWKVHVAESLGAYDMIIG